jgi:multimeric flavodoxin WrbA
MSENVLILNGSPRKNGNTAYLIGKLLEGLREEKPEARVETVRLAELKIAPCRACDACRREDRLGHYCVFRDDMAELYDKVLNADAIVFASPIYWFSVTAQAKLFIDRLYGLWLERTRALRGKTFAAVMVYGDPDPYISGAVNAIHLIEDACRYCGARLAGIVYGTANDIGDAEKSPELQRKARMLGKTLLKPDGNSG